MESLTLICVYDSWYHSQLAEAESHIYASYNALWPVRRLAIIWTNAWLVLIAFLWTICYEIYVKIEHFYTRK